MRTIKSHNLSIMIQELSLLGLAGHDATRLARIVLDDNLQYMQNACRETISSGQNFLFRFAGSDLVVFGPKGYAVIDHQVGCVDLVYSYAYKHTSFAEQTWRYRDEPIDLQVLQEDEQSVAA